MLTIRMYLLILTHPPRPIANTPKVVCASAVVAGPGGICTLRLPADKPVPAVIVCTGANLPDCLHVSDGRRPNVVYDLRGMYCQGYCTQEAGTWSFAARWVRWAFRWVSSSPALHVYS